MSRTKRSDVMLSHAHRMRRQPTEAEKRLWRHLSGARLGGHKFRRQAFLGPYIADFYCPQKKLAVEVDGIRTFPRPMLQGMKRSEIKVSGSCGLQMRMC